MLQDAAQWAMNFFETVAAVGTVLLIGAMIAGAAFWVFRRTVGMLAKPEVDAEPDEDEIEPRVDKVSSDRGSPI